MKGILYIHELVSRFLGILVTSIVPNGFIHGAWRGYPLTFLSGSAVKREIARSGPPIS